MKLLNKVERPLLGRTEAVLEIEFKGVTPSLPEIKKHAALELKSKEELIDIHKVKQMFGKQIVHATIHAYTDKKAYDDFKVINPGEKKAAEEAAKKKDEEKKAAAEAKPAEEPKPEEKKEEKPAEKAPAAEEKKTE